MNEALKVFITYSHDNEEQKTQLETHLAVMVDEGKIRLWDDNQILPGDEWHKEIFDTRLPDSNILLNLTSATSLASINCNEELTVAIRANNIRVISIILSACDWQHHNIRQFQVLPHRGKPINEWNPEEQGWQNVVEGIRRVVDEMLPLMNQSRQRLRAELKFQQGNTYRRLGRMEEAIECYSRAINLDPGMADAYYHRGIAYGELCDFDRAIADYTKAITLNPDFAEAHCRCGLTHNLQGNFDRAITNFDRAIELNPDSADAYHGRGIAYSELCDFDRAIADYTRAITLNPDSAEAHCSRGVAYNVQGNFDRAITDFDRAIELNPDSANAYHGRGLAYYYQGNFDRAITEFDKVIELNPDARSYFYHGLASLHQREWENARTDFRNAISMELDIVVEFHGFYTSIQAFEDRTGIQLPADIAAMLTP